MSENRGERIARLRRELAEAEADETPDMNDLIRQASARVAMPGSEAIARRLGLIRDEE